MRSAIKPAIQPPNAEVNSVAVAIHPDCVEVSASVVAIAASARP